MGDIIDNIAEEFSSGELVLVAEELKLAPTSRWPKRKLIDIINLQLKQKGLPAPVAEDAELTTAQELLEEFLYLAGWVDEDGEVSEEMRKELTLEQFQELHGIPALPPCFSTADDDDPACKRCMVYKYCGQERIIKLPACFGIMLDIAHPECIGCLEAPFCKKAMPEKV